MTITKARFLEVARVGVIAGLAGGLAEVAWIIVYGALSGVSVESVGQEITRSIVPSYAASSSAALIGILIHLILAVGLGISVTFAICLSLRRHTRVFVEYTLVILTLATVWAVNFLLVLPYLNPRFLDLLPYSVTLVSKLLFGLSAATVLRTERSTSIVPASPFNRHQTDSQYAQVCPLTANSGFMHCSKKIIGHYRGRNCEC